MLKWESVAEHSKRTGMSPSSIRNLIKIGELKATKTDGGGKIMILVDEENPDLLAEISEIKKLLTNLCNHLGVDTSN